MVIFNLEKNIYSLYISRYILKPPLLSYLIRKYLDLLLSFLLVLFGIV
jgi:hypothetical protein